MALVLVALGGAIGATLRYLSVVAAARVFGAGFPWGVLSVNVAGSFVMGVVAAVLIERGGSERLALFLMPGLLGGFTTFSAFSLDALRLWETGRMGAASLYVGGSVVAAIAALAAGLVLGRALS